MHVEDFESRFASTDEAIDRVALAAPDAFAIRDVTRTHARGGTVMMLEDEDGGVAAYLLAERHNGSLEATMGVSRSYLGAAGYFNFRLRKAAEELAEESGVPLGDFRTYHVEKARLLNE